MPPITFTRSLTILGAAAAGVLFATGPALAAPEEVETRDDVIGIAVPVTANVFGSHCNTNVFSSSGDCKNTPDEVSDIGF